MRANALETSQHLYQRPNYIGSRGSWSPDYVDILDVSPELLHLDLSAVASYLSFGMVGGERTLFQEIKRQPWLSAIDHDGIARELAVPAHGRKIGSDAELASTLYKLLRDEAREVCQGFQEIYILLSGGLDSRIVAGILSDLYHSGDISAKPIAITWGLANSRDVVYAKRVADILGFDWKHVEFGPEDVLLNIDATVRKLGLLHSPEMLHGMLWFDKIPADSLVIAGSFGDSIGRAEFMGEHLLQLSPRAPVNSYQVMVPGVFSSACNGLYEDLGAIHGRASGELADIAKNELWMQGYRMRGGLCHALSIINSNANIYQMFTAPAVYRFMWSLHPARRDDRVYATLLETYFRDLARVPWPRINRALSGKTVGADSSLLPHYHEYTKWSSGPLLAELEGMVDPDWFNETGIFVPDQIRRLGQLVKQSTQRVGRLNDIWLWLAGFRSMCEHLERTGKKLKIDAEVVDEPVTDRPTSPKIMKFGVLAASKSSRLNSMLKSVRSTFRKIQLARTKRKFLKEYPPVEIS